MSCVHFKFFSNQKDWGDEHKLTTTYRRNLTSLHFFFIDENKLQIKYQKFISLMFIFLTVCDILRKF